MFFSFFNATERRRRRILRAIPRTLTAQQMRDIGLEPWPERRGLLPPSLW